MSYLISDTILGLSLTKFLLHLLNFAILFIALWFILYKPVMKFIRERQERIAKQQEEAAENLRVAEEARATEEEKLRTLDAEIEEKRAAAEREISLKCEEKIHATELRAEEIVKDAENRAKAETDKLVSEAREGIKEAAITLASNIIEDKIDSVDDALIDSALKDWQKNG